MKITKDDVNMLIRYLVVVAVAFGAVIGLIGEFQAGASTSTMDENIKNSSTYFEENKGQFIDKVEYFVRGTSGYDLFLTSTESVYVVRKPNAKNIKADILNDLEKLSPKLQNTGATAIYMTMLGSNPNSKMVGLNILPNRTNYFKGSDQSNWQTNVVNYQSVRTNQIYDGIDLLWNGDQNDIQFAFVLHPNADLSKIEWKIDGAEDVKIESNGDLLIRTEDGEIKQRRPRLYYEADNFLTEVGSRFTIQKTNSAASQFLRIEPNNIDQEEQKFSESNVLTSELGFSTFLGGTSYDSGDAIAIDAVGNSYVAGVTRSPQFPTTPGPIDPSLGGLEDVFVTKINATGSGLVYSTYLGGSDLDSGSGIFVDALGNVYLTGKTTDAAIDYPTTPGSYNTLHNGTYDAFVTKINPSGSVLIYSTFIGGTNADQALGMAVDNSGSAYITGFTGPNPTGSAFPTTIGAFDTTQNGSQDAFVTKINPSGSALVYSTFLGGNAFDAGKGIAVDNLGNAYITGDTLDASVPFPTTAGVFSTSVIGSDDVFVTKLNPSGSALIYSTFFGGGGRDGGGSGIAVNSLGNAFITGWTQSAPFPTTPGAYDTTRNSIEPDAFITKFNIDGSALVFSTLLGGNGSDLGVGIKVDNSDNVHVIGLTNGDITSNFPTTVGAYDTTHNSGGDTFVSTFNSSGSNLLYSTFLGGFEYDYPNDFAVDTLGNAYLTGNTGVFSTKFPAYPTTNGAYSTSYNGGQADAFVTKLTIPKPGSSPFDFDGDGKTDISVFRPSVGEWYFQRSGNGVVNGAQFGASTDKPVPADYTGDGKTDIAFFRPSSGQWFVLRSEDSSFFAFPFGVSTDIPTVGDFDGDGKADQAVFRPSVGTWFINRSTGGTTIQPFGTNGDRPVVADYDGDGKSDIAIFRPSVGEWYTLRSSDSQVRGNQFGASTDKPVQGDYTGDGKADFAFFRPSTGSWFVLRSEDSSFFASPFGISTDTPTVGDYDGDGKFDQAVFRPSEGVWYVNRSTSGLQIQAFGATTDLPVPNYYLQ